MKRLVKFRIAFGSQILLYDESSANNIFEFDYGDKAYSRGFAEAQGAIAIFPLVEYGLADVSVWEGHPNEKDQFDKVIAITVYLESGELCIHNPEDPPLTLSVGRGNVRATIGQRKTECDGLIEIEIFLREEENQTS